MVIKLNKCTLTDLQTVQNIAIETFTETYEDKNTPENFKLYIENSFSLEQLEKEMLHKDSQFFLLSMEDEVIGYLKVNTDDAQTVDMDEHSLEIQRIYVKEKYQKQGIGKILLTKAEQIAKESNKKIVWLGVWEKNENAIGFYKRMGYEQTGAFTFYLGDEKQQDFIMSKNME